MTVNQKSRTNYLPIGKIAQRTGLAVSAIRYYESEKLVHPIRNAAGQRQFLKADIRRLSFIMIAQNLGFTLEQIRVQLNKLPDSRTPNKHDWAKISASFKNILDERITSLTLMRDKLDQCIGCGCLSLTACTLYNPDDKANARGNGPRYLLGDEPEIKKIH